MFGLDATEMMVLVIVGIVVVGPKKLPEMMRTAGKWIAKLRRMSTSLRSQSGIDEILRIEGLEKEMRELRALTRINVMDSLVNAAERPRAFPRQLGSGGGGSEEATPSKDGGVAKARPAAASASRAVKSPAANTESASSDAPSTEPPSTDAPATDAPSTEGVAVVPPPGAPPPGVVPRSKRAPIAIVALPGEAPLPEREWPSIGCDAYDALPDDLEESEGEEPQAAEPQAAEPQVAEPQAAGPSASAEVP